MTGVLVGSPAPAIAPLCICDGMFSAKVGNGKPRTTIQASRYLVYLNNRAAGKRSVKTIDLCDQKTAPLTPKSFIYNRRSYSQAGRRGFESRLPLHLFNNLQASRQRLAPIGSIYVYCEGVPPSC